MTVFYPTAPPPLVQPQHGFVLVRDDLVVGGTKRRVLERLMGEHPLHVYASPAQGMAQVALARAAATTGTEATIFVAERKVWTEQTHAASKYGALIVTMPHGYLSVVTARARAYAAAEGAYLWPHGLDTPEFRAALAEIARDMPITPTEVWCAAGSGVLTRSLQAAWPQAEHHAVLVGHEADTGNATRHRAPERFDQRAKTPPPYPSHATYDAKVWQFVSRHGSPGALVWNVA